MTRTLVKALYQHSEPVRIVFVAPLFQHDPFTCFILWVADSVDQFVPVLVSQISQLGTHFGGQRLSVYKSAGGHNWIGQSPPVNKHCDNDTNKYKDKNWNWPGRVALFFYFWWCLDYLQPKQNWLAYWRGKTQKDSLDTTVRTDLATQHNKSIDRLYNNLNPTPRT